MANEPLESIKFPGIANTFTVPPVDNTLAVQGAAADAKAVGDALNNLDVDATLTRQGKPADAKKVGDEISVLKADLNEKVAISKIEGYYINLTTDPVDIANPSSSSTGLAYSIVDCAEGDKFIINAVGAVSGRAWGFLDSGNHVISTADVDATITNLELIAPANAVKLVINDKGGLTSYKVGKNILGRVETLETDVEELQNAIAAIEPGLSDEAKAALLACFEHVAWIDKHGQDYYDALYNALYNTYDVFRWAYSDGRLPSSEDGFALSGNGNTATFDSANGMHIVGSQESWDNVYRILLNSYKHVQKGIFEINFKINSIGYTGIIMIRCGDGQAYMAFLVAKLDIDGYPVLKSIYRTGEGTTTTNNVIDTINLNQEYTAKLEYSDSGKIKIYLDNELVVETNDRVVSSALDTRFLFQGALDVYVTSIKCMIQEGTED